MNSFIARHRSIVLSFQYSCHLPFVNAPTQ
jgi:hypothetical protein